MHSRRLAAYTLIELSLVVLVLSLLAAAVFRYSTNITLTNNNNALKVTLDTIETALQNYSNLYGRLPCPADPSAGENEAAFGVEVGTPGDGTCTGAYFRNSNDPDNDPDSVALDPLYDPASAGKVVGGSVPTKTLKIDDKYAFDPWGHKIFIVIDQRITTTNAFTTYSVVNTVIGAVVVKKATGDTLANAITYKGVYGLVAYGPNGHGSFQRTPATSNIRLDSDSTNTDEQTNCHCDNDAGNAQFTRIFIQKPKIQSSTVTDVFDDVVRFKTRQQMANYYELQ